MFATVGWGDLVAIVWTDAGDRRAAGLPVQDVDPLEFVATLEAGEHDFEVLAIEASGNQTLTEGTFTK